MRREFHVRFWEGGGVRFPSATRLVACFQYETDARRFPTALDGRLGKFQLEVEPSKTRILRFGRFATRDVERRGERVAVFDFLGLTHYCGTSRAGRFKLKWRTSMKRLRAKLHAMRERTSGSERGQGTIVVGEGGVNIGWGASFINTRGASGGSLLAPPRIADPHDAHRLREALPYSP